MLQSKWPVIGASCQGRSHQSSGVACQDAWIEFSLGSHGLAVIVADGAGSAVMGADGARLACLSGRSFLERESKAWKSPLRELDWPALWHALLDVVRVAIRTMALEAKLPEREFATTLIVLVATPDFVSVGHVGDGAVVVSRHGGIIETLSAPEHGEAANEVVFVTSDSAPRHLRAASCDGPICAVAAFTDGLEDLLLGASDASPHVPAFQRLFEFANGHPDPAAASGEMGMLLASSRVAGRTGDDLTLVIASFEAGQ